MFWGFFFHYQNQWILNIFVFWLEILTKSNKLPFWEFCKESAFHSVSVLPTDLPWGLLQNPLDYIHISMGLTVPGTTLWHNSFTIFQFRVSWGLCCSPPGWDFLITELRKWHSFSVLQGLVEGRQEHWQVGESAESLPWRAALRVDWNLGLVCITLQTQPLASAATL